MSVSVAAVAFVAAAVLTGIVREYAIRARLLDHPNERSSHTRPTPRGGGAAIVLAFTGAAAVLAFSGEIPPDLAAAVIGGGVMVAIVGSLDDRRPLPATVRLVVHCGAAV